MQLLRESVPELLNALIGGIFGFAIAWFVFRLQRKRDQVISYELHITPIQLKPQDVPLKVETTITVKTHLGIAVEVERLYAVRLMIKNTSTESYFERFDFGVTFPHDVFVLDERREPPDRHHTIDFGGLPKLDDLAAWLHSAIERDYQQRDYELKPFNKGDVYAFEYTIAPIRLTLNNKPDDAGGWTTDAVFVPSSTTVTDKNFLVGSPMSGIHLFDSTRIDHRRGLIDMEIIFSPLYLFLLILTFVGLLLVRQYIESLGQLWWGDLVENIAATIFAAIFLLLGLTIYRRSRKD